MKKKTYVRDFPLKMIGGATAEKTQKAIWNCMEKQNVVVRHPKDLEGSKEINIQGINAYHIRQEKPTKAQSTISPVKRLHA